MLVLLTSTLVGRPLQRRDVCTGNRCGSPTDVIANKSDQSDDGHGLDKYVGIIMAVAFVLVLFVLWVAFANWPKRKLREWLRSRRKDDVQKIEAVDLTEAAGELAIPAKVAIVDEKNAKHDADVGYLEGHRRNVRRFLYPSILSLPFSQRPSVHTVTINR
ncbi:uncharacterized protein EV420DRAFT_939696 [Desarmillaria tabescens]|uniref:Uncharacterized protein n=1 Tax=Armillaria tabescens TaxID=1929756 RepID=A0AA39NGB6_ARMTA|nr:uncharacterized protein EV420DRAFT_939696 [Desarmillaria tabescens]KAK0465114.1 hypothetical protein EV420DRAFT_939696 [Desarmillaria tabescens]